MTDDLEAALRTTAPAGSDGVATFVSSQVDGLKALRARVPVAIGRGLEVVDDLSERLLSDTGGKRVRSTNEGWLAMWPSTTSAVSYCLRLQEELLRVDWPPTLVQRPEAAEVRAAAGEVLFRGLRVRQGVHVGRPEVAQLPDGPGIGGPAVLQVARVASVAHGGQVVLTEQAWRRMRGALASTPVLRDLGSHELEGVRGRGRLFQVMPMALDRREFPRLGSRTATRTNLPERASSFFGRSGDLTALAELDSFGVRLITIVGEPGSGASSLARYHAQTHGERYRAAGGVWLAAVEGPGVDELVAAVGGALAVPLVMGRARQDVVEHLGYALAGRGLALLVLDGGQVAREELAPIVAQWLRAAPELHVVCAASSRLGVKGEVTYALGPLAVGDGEAAGSSDAARLFAARAAEVRSGDPLQDLETVRASIRAVRGNPLAVELVAGLVDRMDPSAVVGALGDGIVEVHRVVEVAWSQLNPDERRVLQAASVFAGSFEYPALADLVDDDLRPVVREALDALVSRGLARAAVDGRASGTRRFDVHARVRAVVLRRMETEHQVALRERLAEQLLARCEPRTDLAWGPEGPEVVASLALKRANLVEIVRWGAEREDASTADVGRALRALVALQPLFVSRGPTPLFLELLDRALEQADRLLGADPLLQVRVLAARADALRHAGRARLAVPDLERGQAIADRWADVEGGAICATSLALVQRDLGYPELAIQTLERSREAFARCGAALREGVACGALGVMQMDMGQLRGAERSLQEAIQALRRLGARHFEAMYMVNLGLLYRRTGRGSQTRDLYREALRIHQEVGERRLESIALLNLSVLEYHLGNLVDARRWLDQSRALAREIGDRRTEAACLGNLGLVSAEEGDLAAARQGLVTAMALHRALEDRRGEGLNLGYLGVVQRIAGQRDAARESLRRALGLVESTGVVRAEAQFVAWLGVLDADAGRPDLGAAAFARARELAARDEDESSSAVIDALELALALVAGDPPDDVAARLSVITRRRPDDGEIRLVAQFVRSSIADKQRQAGAA